MVTWTFGTLAALQRLNRGQRLTDEPRIRTMGVMVTELVTLLCQRAGLRHPFHLCLLLFSGFRLGGMLSFISVEQQQKYIIIAIVTAGTNEVLVCAKHCER